MKLLLLVTALSSIFAVSHAQWSFDTYTDFKCQGTSATTSQATNVGVTCKSLGGNFPSGTQNGGTEDGCQIMFHTSSDCSDVGCQGLGTCCSRNDESTQWTAYSVLCEQA